MPRRLNLPDSASVATPAEDGKLFAPSADRNTSAIVELVQSLAPTSGKALELASGTGQHIVALATSLPDLMWQPSEVDPTRLSSIRAYVTSADLPNIGEVQTIDATSDGWGEQQQGQDLITLSNLLHLISMPETKTLIQEAAHALSTNGQLVIYGPFKRDDALTSEGDIRFDQSLRQQDPEIGYKSDQDVIKWGVDAGLSLTKSVDMPANNLAICWRKNL